jgi:hypothetical protein
VAEELDVDPPEPELGRRQLDGLVDLVVQDRGVVFGDQDRKRGEVTQCSVRRDQRVAVEDAVEQRLQLLVGRG